MTIAVSRFTKCFLLLACSCGLPVVGMMGLLHWQCSALSASGALSESIMQLEGTMIGGAFVLTSLSIALLYAGASRLMKPVAEQQQLIIACQEVMQRLKAGDLRTRLEAIPSQDYVTFRDVMNDALQKLHRSICTAATTGDEVVRAAELVSDGSLSIADEATRQSATLEEIAASLEQMTQMTSHTSRHAETACDLANETYSCAQRGDGAMAKLVTSIDRIKASCDQQARILRTIDEIAFQTNLLAVNAAVEAARVGEAGRGFAVVADEVRALAQRCSEAAQTTAAMLESANKHTQEGVHITDEMGFVLSNIQERARRTNNCISSIAAASREQAIGIQHATDAVAQLDCVTQQLTANSHRSADIANGLSRQVATLNTVIEGFELDREVHVETLIATTSRDSLRESKTPRKAPRTVRRTTPILPPINTPLDQVLGAVNQDLGVTSSSVPKPADPAGEIAQSSIDAMLSTARSSV